MFAINKKTWVIAIVMLAILAAVIVCLLPKCIWVDVSLHAVKLDVDGNETGTADIRIKGCKLDYLFFEDRLVVQCSQFDNLRTYDVELLDSSQGVIYPPAFVGEYLLVHLGGWNTRDKEPFAADLGFSEDFDRWAFCNKADETYYVASVSGNYSTAELAEYFEGLTPYRWFYDS